MAREVLNDGETKGVIRSKINGNFTELYDTRWLLNIAALRAATWPAGVPSVIFLISNWAIGDEGARFRLDSSDTTSTDNSGTVIVDTGGRRWKRIFDDTFRPEFFGDCTTNVGFTAALQAAITAAGTNARISVPSGRTLTSTITLLTGQVLQGRNGRSQIFKGFNGDMINMSADQCGLEDIWLRGQGASFTGRGVVINAGAYQYMESVWVYDTANFALDFTASNAGTQFRAERCTFQRTSPTDPAISLPTTIDTNGNRRFINCSSDGAVFLRFNSGLNTWIIGSDFTNLDFSASNGISLRATVTGCRIAALGGSFDVWGNDSAIVGNVIAGAGTLNGSASRNNIAGNTLLANQTWTDNSNATGNDINIIDYAIHTPTPVWSSTGGTQPSIGNGTLSAQVVRRGKVLAVDIQLVIGSTTTFGTGDWFFRLPAPFAAYKASRATTGVVRVFDSGTSWFIGTAWMNGSDDRIFMSTSNSGSQIGPTAPMAWANGDNLTLRIEFVMA